MFLIEDERHAERIGEFNSREDALAELQRLAGIPWDKEPNLAPCGSWATCGRSYEIIEYDTSQKPWRELDRTLTLQVSADGISWF